MIITCEQCVTQFHLDDAKIPSGGARVRCSRCKHAFFIEGRTAAPHPTEDPSAAAAATGSDFEDSDDPSNESDWEFNQAPTSGAASAPSQPAATHDAAREAIDDLLSVRPLPTARRQAPSSAVAPDPGADEEDLGSPESWDLLTGNPSSASDPGGSREPEAAGAEIRRDPAVAGYRGGPSQSVAEWTPPSEPSVVLAWIARMGHTIGWSATAILFSIVAMVTLAPTISPEAEAVLGRQPLAGLEAREISARWVENAVGGALFVVSGRLANPTAEPAALGTPIGVRLLDATGARLPGDPAAAGPVLLERELREADPAGIRAHQAEAGLALAAERIQPGQSLAFEAVVGAVPLAASRFVLEPLAPGRVAPLAAAGEPSSVRAASPGSL